MCLIQFCLTTDARTRDFLDYIDRRRYATSTLSMDATNFSILARSIPSSPSVLVLIDSRRRMPLGLSGRTTSQTHHRRTCFVFGCRVVDIPSGNQETAVAPWGNRNRVWKYERNAEGRKGDKDKEDKNASFKTYGGKKEKRGLRLMRGKRIMRSERKTWI